MYAHAIPTGKSLTPKRYALLAALFLLASCATTGQQADRLVLKPTTFSALSGWERDDHAQALAVFKNSCAVRVKQKKEPTKPSRISPRLEQWRSVCAQAASTPADARSARHFFEEYFTPVALTNNGKHDGLITGYYVPSFAASAKQSAQFATPVYALPKDVKKGVPYYTRSEIRRGALAGRGLSIAWAQDPIELFFAEIQGSAELVMEDGSKRYIGYAGKNNHAYTAIGKLLLDEGALNKQNVSMQSIKQWLRNNPSQANRIMDANESYVFFRLLKEGSPPGAQGVPLVAGRSLAVDARNLAYGLPVYLTTTLPQTSSGDGGEFSRLMIAQDTGGAIKGSVRADVFWGSGQHAEWVAGNMKQRGEMVVLVPRQLVPELVLE